MHSTLYAWAESRSVLGRIVLASMMMTIMAAANTVAFAQVSDRTVPRPLGQTPAVSGDATDMPSTEQLQRGALRREAAQQATDASAARLKAVEKNPDAWRYRYHNGKWWYYTPEHRWMVHSNNQWTYHSPQPSLPPRYNTGYRGPNRNYRPGFRGPSGIRQVNPPPVDNFGPANDTINGTDSEAIPGSIGHGVGAGDGGANTAPLIKLGPPAPAGALPN